MYKTITTAAASLAAAGTVIGATIDGLDVVDSLIVVAQIQGITGGTLDIYWQAAPKESAVWVDVAHYAQLADGASAIIRSFALSRSGQVTALATVGMNGTPALAANTVLGGDFGERLRPVFVVGSGASLGAVQTFHIIGSEAKRRA